MTSRASTAKQDPPNLEVVPAPDEAGPAQGPAQRLDARSPAAREEAREELQVRLAAHMPRGRARVVVTDNVHTMVSIKRGQGVTTFRVHHMFLDAPSRVVRALARYAHTQDRQASAELRAFIDANDAKIRRSATREVVCDVAGRHHNLKDVFDELNARYFDGKIRARITWGPRTRRRPGRRSIKLGSYDFEQALIRIHPVLDASDVPRFYLAWVVYHEMLHEVHDIPVVDGRRVYHTPEFRRAEAQFDRYAEAVMWERVNLGRLLNR